MGEINPGEQFVRSLIQHQNKIYAYILTLVADTSRAHDLLQETMVELWTNAAKFAPNTDFVAWACRVAYFKVLAYRRDRGREPLLFSSELLETLALACSEEAARGDSRSSALSDCVSALPGPQQRLIMDRYAPGGSVKKLAAKTGRSAQGLAVTLHRIRQSLLDCISAKLQTDAS
jgi:RNA polymerase sigma-70 factor, ECF subfamily